MGRRSELIHRSRSKRLTDWGFGPGGTGLTTISSSSTVILGSGISLTGRPATLVRTRGLFRMYLENVANPGEGFQGAFAIGVVQVAAFTAGVGSLPGPISEMDSEAWLYHSIVGAHAHNATETSFNESTVFDLTVDSKAMRKLDDETVIVAVLEVVELGTAVLDVFFDSRVLLKT